MAQGPVQKFLTNTEKHEIIQSIKKAHTRTYSIRTWTKNRPSRKTTHQPNSHNQEKKTKQNKRTQQSKKSSEEDNSFLLPSPPLQPSPQQEPCPMRNTSPNARVQSTSKWDAEIQQRFKEITDFIEKTLKE
jgi:hypothetical protein